MKAQDEIENKIAELEQKLEELDEEFQETLEDEEIDEFSPQGEDLEAEYNWKKEVVEKQIDLLRWILS